MSSPEGPRFAPEAKDKKKKNRQGQAPVSLASFVSVETKPINSANKPKLGRVDGALAGLTIENGTSGVTRKDTKPSIGLNSTEHQSDEARKEKPSSTSESELNQAPLHLPPEKQIVGDDTAKTNRYYEALVSHEPDPSRDPLNMGEVILFRHDDEEASPQEHEVLLHDPAATESEKPPQSSSDSEDKVSLPAAERSPITSHEAAAAPPPAEAGGGGGGEKPPVGPPETSRGPYEEPPRRPPVEVLPPPGTTYETAHLAGGATRLERAATKQEVEQAVYYATRAAHARGLIVGLFAGGLYEHFKHRRREKRQEKRHQKRFKQQSKQLEQARKDYAFGLQEQARRQSETNLRFNELTKRFENTPAPEKLLPKAPEKPPLETGEPLAIPTDHRLETSSWHSIEVDAKTGKPVETPAFQYGHEYHRERAQENTPAAQRNMAAGEVALVAAAGGLPGGTSATDSTASLAPANIPDASTQGTAQKSSTAADKSTSGKQAADKPDNTTGPLWPWLVALLVIVVCLALLLR